MMNQQISLMTGLCFISAVTLAGEVKTFEKNPSAVEAIRAEATRKNLDPDGRPLPLAAHFNRGAFPVSFQLELIEKGHHILPWIKMFDPEDSPGAIKAPPKKGKIRIDNTEEEVKQLAALKLPFSFITGGQWEGDLYDSKLPWRDLPPEKSALTWLVEPIKSKDGKEKPTTKQLSPLGAVEPWKEVGKRWIDNPMMRKVAEIYPDPSLVLFSSNNEAARLKPADIEKDKRYMDRYGKPGTELSDVEKRKLVGDGWLERYGAMISSMRESLPSDAWKKSAKFVAYNGMGPRNWGRPLLPNEKGTDWKDYSQVTEDRIDPKPYFWDGAMPEYYDNPGQDSLDKNIFNVFSCQVEMMNYVFQKEEVFTFKPDFWFEVAFWDGDKGQNPDQAEIGRYKTYEDMGFPSTPARYKAWVEYGMWLLTPRVAREYRASSDTRDRFGDYFQQVIDAVDLVYADPILTKFWRKGNLVSNRAHEHPFNVGIPAKWKNVDRWFNLDTNIDPPRPWEMKTRLPIFSLARVMGKAPNREWLVFGHAPMGDKKKVEITIPEYKSITVDIALAGSFYHVREEGGSVTEVGKKM